MLKEGKRLHGLGFAIHWLKANSKMPVESGWTTGERKEWGYLKDHYRYGLNMGVRLGKPTRFPDGTHLAVIDCDVKSEKYRSEMEEKLAELGITHAPQVSSGRGNGSRHLYVRTAKPVEPYRYSQSGKKVRVSMPSSAPSRQEKETLSEADLKQGIRLRYAWEISVMGTGQQVVLPPSIHPDTGNTYEWVKPLDAWEEIPLVKLSGATEKRDRPWEEFEDKASIFTPVPIDYLSLRIPDEMVDLILSGVGCQDRSASLYKITIALLKHRYSDDEILSILTDRETYLGETAFDHGHTQSRARAAQWVKKYTLARAKRETAASLAFKENVVEERLDDVAAEKQARALLPQDWKDKLERSSEQMGGKPKPTFENIRLILQGVSGVDVFKYDDFTFTIYCGHDTPWGGKAKKELAEIDLVLIKSWLAKDYRMEPSINLILEVVQKIAHQNRYHPIRDYLKRLSWDGTERLDNWLTDYMGAKGPKEYVQAIGRKTLVAMVARVMRPGCKFDHILILEGKQGCGKSTAVRTLAEPWFSDAYINVGDKDAVLAMRLAWVMEIGELSSMNRADLDMMKQFTSQAVDRIRVPYGRVAESFPRQSIFIGTTNSSEYLKDTTGNRRFWPVQVKQCRFDELARDRDQLLAEALAAYSLGEPLFLEQRSVEEIASIEQNKRLFVDEWVSILDEFLQKPNENFPKEFTIGDLFGGNGPFPNSRCERKDQMRAGDCLRLLNYTKRKMRVGNIYKNVWVKIG